MVFFVIDAAISLDQDPLEGRGWLNFNAVRRSYLLLLPLARHLCDPMLWGFTVCYSLCSKYLRHILLQTSARPPRTWARSCMSGVIVCNACTVIPKCTAMSLRPTTASNGLMGDRTITIGCNWDDRVLLRNNGLFFFSFFIFLYFALLYNLLYILVRLVNQGFNILVYIDQ